MKKKVLILIGIISCLIFSVLPGCGCGQQQEVMETVSTVEGTEIESESVSIEETTEEETIPEETTMEQTESTEEQSEMVIETEGIEIQDMSAVMYTTANVVLRQEPSTESEKLRTVSAGEEVEVTGQTVDGLWFRVEEGDTVGYISAGYLSLEKPVIESSEPSSETQTQQPADQLNQATQNGSSTADATPDTAEGDAILGDVGIVSNPNNVVREGDSQISGSSSHMGDILHAE